MSRRRLVRAPLLVLGERQLTPLCEGTYIADAPIWLNETVGKSLGANAHHQYGFASASRQQQVFEEGRNLSGGVPTWFTEICCECRR